MINLMHGDCLERMAEIPDGSVDMVLADPPYGTSKCKWDSIIPLDEMWAHLKRVIKPNGAIVMTASQPFTTKLISSNYAMFRYEWVWQKDNHTNFLHIKKQPAKRHENVCVFYKKQPEYNPQMWKGKESHSKGVKRKKSTRKYLGADLECSEDIKGGMKYPISIYLCKGEGRGKAVHPTQKPVALMGYLIKTYTNVGETVLDFTMGSGTTGVACVNTGRDFIGIELDPEYYQIACGRILGDSNLIYVTTFDPETKEATGKSAESGFDSLEQVRQSIPDEPIKQTKQMIIYPGVVFSGFQFN